jgi:hypothetical protein
LPHVAASEHGDSPNIDHNELKASLFRPAAPHAVFRIFLLQAASESLPVNVLSMFATLPTFHAPMFAFILPALSNVNDNVVTLSTLKLESPTPVNLGASENIFARVVTLDVSHLLISALKAAAP